MKRFLIAIPLALSACATITAEHTQTIAIETTPAGAACVLSNSRGAWRVEKTPGSVEIPRGFEPVQVRCELAGAGIAEDTLTAKTRGRAYGNILLGGFPAYVDAGSGAGYEFEQESLTLTLKPAP